MTPRSRTDAAGWTILPPMRSGSKEHLGKRRDDPKPDKLGFRGIEIMMVSNMCLELWTRYLMLNAVQTLFYN